MALSLFKKNKPAEQGPTAAAKSGKRILLCDGDAFYGEAISLLLSKHGYDVSVVGSGEEVLPRLEGERFDMVLCAIQLPGKDGFAVLKEVRATQGFNRLPFIFLTTVTGFDALDRAQQGSATDYFIKKEAGLDRLPELIKKYLP